VKQKDGKLKKKKLMLCEDEWLCAFKTQEFSEVLYIIKD
jgi:hypothetical protein